MPQNSFKRLAEEKEKEYVPPPELEQRVMAQIYLLQIMGKAVELYMPQLVQMLFQMMGHSVHHIGEMFSQKEPIHPPSRSKRTAKKNKSK